MWSQAEEGSKPQTHGGRRSFVRTLTPTRLVAAEAEAFFPCFACGRGNDVICCELPCTRTPLNIEERTALQSPFAMSVAHRSLPLLCQQLHSKKNLHSGAKIATIVVTLPARASRPRLALEAAGAASQSSRRQHALRNEATSDLHPISIVLKCLLPDAATHDSNALGSYHPYTASPTLSTLPAIPGFVSSLLRPPPPNKLARSTRRSTCLLLGDIAKTSSSPP